MPDNPAPYLTDWLFEIGPTSADGGVLSWIDLEAWCRITGIELEPWEARLIRRLSAEYGSMRVRAEKADCAAPFIADQPLDVHRDRVTDQFKAMLGVLKAKP